MSKLTLAFLSAVALADGVSQNTVQVVATDDSGAPLVGHVVTLSVDSGTVTPTSTATDANGTVTAALSSSVAGTVTLTALLEDGVTTASIPVEFSAVTQPVVVPAAAAPAVPVSALDAMKYSAASLAAKIGWIESRITELGKEAEADVIALAEKYGLKF